MVDFVNCNYEEALVQRLETASRELFVLLPDEGEEDRRILLENTEALNRELNSYRKLKSNLVESTQLSAIVKRKLREQYVPKSLYTQFDIANLRTVKDFVGFVNHNLVFFREVFPTQDSITETVASLDPIGFRPFEVEYPNIAVRLRSGPVSSAEVNGLIRENGIDPRLFASQVRTKRNSVFDLLNKFLAKLGIGIGIMGSFCALVEDVFALSKGQRDLTGNSAQFLGNFTNVLGLINPKAGEVVEQVQELISLLTSAQQASTDVATNIEGAFSALGGALGVIIKFADVVKAAKGETQPSGGIEVSWNLPAISAAILANDLKLTIPIPQTGKPLGDINQDGVMNGDDATAFDTYITNTATPEVKSYVDNIFLPYLNQNAAGYSEFSNLPGASQSGGSQSASNALSSLSSVAGAIGAGPGSGDFGISKILQTISIATSIISSIQSLANGSKPVNIQGLFGQLDQILQLGDQATQDMFKDFNGAAREYKTTVDEALKEAESVAVDDKPKAAEISEQNQASLENNITQALEISGENSKNLGPRLVDMVNGVRNGIRQLAAVGVLENLEQQISSVIDQSASGLKSRISLFSPSSINNGFNVNMSSSFGKMAGLIGQASNAASEDTTNAMKDSVKGMIAQSAEKFRQKNKEEVEFVALRFCKLVAEIERMYEQITKPLETTTSNFSDANRNLSRVGNEVTIRAVQAGALRLDTQARIAAMQQAGSIPATQASFYTTPAGVITNVPTQNTLPMDVLPPLPADYEFPSYDDAIAGRGGILYAPGPSSRLSGRAGFTAKSAGGGVDTEALRRLYQLAQQWGQTIRINSAYRSPAANAAAGGAKNSFHMTGKAFDCGVSGRSNQIIFMNLAYRVGFRGFGSYGTFTHIDTRGGPSSWGSFRYYDLPGPPGAKVG